MTSDQYMGIGMLFAIPAFIISYIYCIAIYGFLFGVGLGWLPSFIVAFVVLWLWPFIAIALAILVIMVARGS